jgi:lipopolysaccharide biosynthesis glycosyltransferase
MNKQVIPVFFTIDEGYAPWLSVALVSMKENASPNYHYKVHIIHKDLSEKTQKRLEALGDEDFEILCSDMPHDLEMIDDRIGNRLRADYFTLTIFFRLFLADLFPQYDKAIYLDSDICVPGDVSKLYETNLEGNLLGVVNDYSISHVPELVNYVQQAIGVAGDRYFNSGILLMDFKQIREKNLAGRFLYLLSTYRFDSIAPDQDYLNAMCKDRVLYLDPVWDSMPCKADAFEHPMIIHYNLFDKPWCYDNIPYEEYFWLYAPKSGFYEEIRSYKDNYSDEQKQKDSESLAFLVARGAELVNQENTMKSVFESGKEARL